MWASGSCCCLILIFFDFSNVFLIVVIKNTDDSKANPNLHAVMEFLLFITGIAGGTTAVCQEVALGIFIK